MRSGVPLSIVVVFKEISRFVLGQVSRAKKKAPGVVFVDAAGSVIVEHRLLVAQPDRRFAVDSEIVGEVHSKVEAEGRIIIVSGHGHDVQVHVGQQEVELPSVKDAFVRCQPRVHPFPYGDDHRREG